ncbi:MAG: SIR2 family NAD-dependent protein deacylase [Ilumatobacteraceae bacterium]
MAARHGSSHDDAIERAAALVAAASSVAVLTGAGISTAAGIPDFRGPNGVWTKNPGAEKASTIAHYLADEETRQWAWQRRVQLADLSPQPTAAHLALLHLEQRGVLVGLATQNIDGLHHAAGSDPSLVHEVHGSNRLSHCVSCRGEWPTSVFLDRVRAGEADPPCADCGGIVKPAVVFFGEMLPRAALDASMAAAEACDVLLAAGTTLGVGPINAMVPRAKRFGASVVILNDSPTEMDGHADVIVRGDIQQVLPAVVGG